MTTIEIENLKALRESLCVAQSAIGQAYGQRQSEYTTSKIKTIQKVLDQIDILRPLGPDGKHGNRHTEYCGCEDNPYLIMLDEWRAVPGFDGYELSGRGELREGYYESEPEPYAYRPEIDSDGKAWFTLWPDGMKGSHTVTRADLLALVFPELNK